MSGWLGMLPNIPSHDQIRHLCAFLRPSAVEVEKRQSTPTRLSLSKLINIFTLILQMSLV